MRNRHVVPQPNEHAEREVTRNSGGAVARSVSDPVRLHRCLTIPGLDCSGPDHWQSLWEERRDDCRRVEMGCWSDPTREAWIGALDRATALANDIILVAHSLGCLAVAWWAASSDRVGRVRAAMLVAPPDVDRSDADPRLIGFAPTPSARLPFPSILVASTTDDYARFERSREIADGWGATLIDAGDIGHINVAAGVGAWPDGERLLDALIAAQAGPSMMPQRQTETSDGR